MHERVIQPHALIAKTRTLHGRGPKAGHGDTHDEPGNDGPDAKGYEETQDEVATNSDVAVGKDSEVLQRNGDFGEG